MFLFQHRLVRLQNLCLVSLTGRSLVCNRFAGMGEIVLADWLTYYIQVSLSVKGFVRPISKFVLQSFCQTTLLFFTPFFGARANYMHSPFSVKGFFETRLFLFSRNRFSFCAVLDSEAQLYAYRQIESRGICAILNFLRLKIQFFKVKSAFFVFNQPDYPLPGRFQN